MERPLLSKLRPRPAAASPLVLLCLVAYLGSGISQPLAMSAVRLAGLGDTTCQLYMLPYYLGQAATGLLAVCEPSPRRRWSSFPLHRCAAIALVSAVAQNMNYAGNMLAGSAIFAVVYSSVTVWCALLSRLLLQRVLNPAQWAAVLLVFFGLALAGLGARSDGSQVLVGAGMVVVGSFLHAFTHVVSELVSVRGGKVPPQINCCVQGLTACLVVGAWECVYTLPHLDKVLEPAQTAGTSLQTAVLLLGSLAVGNFVHAASFFYLLARIGAVSAGVAKALQAVAVFLLSHVLYCEQDASQCLTPAKTTSLVVVVSGALAYALATAAAATTAAKAAPADKGAKGP